MKGSHKTLAVLAILAVLCVAIVGKPAYSSIIGSEHDLSARSLGSDEVCVFCHTPHSSDVSVTEAPLWNREVSTATYQVYVGVDMQGSVNQPSGISLLCLSCHDGTVALENFGGNTLGTTMIDAGHLIGTDLRNDHPVAFAYTDAVATADGQLELPASALSGLGGTIQADMLFSDNLECASCHDVHNDDNNGKLLRIDNTNSDLCLTCHIK